MQGLRFSDFTGDCEDDDIERERSEENQSASKEPAVVVCPEWVRAMRNKRTQLSVVLSKWLNLKPLPVHTDKMLMTSF